MLRLIGCLSGCYHAVPCSKRYLSCFLAVGCCQSCIGGKIRKRTLEFKKTYHYRSICLLAFIHIGCDPSNPDDPNKIKKVIVRAFCNFSFSHYSRRQSSRTSHSARTTTITPRRSPPLWDFSYPSTTPSWRSLGCGRGWPAPYSPRAKSPSSKTLSKIVKESWRLSLQMPCMFSLTPSSSPCPGVGKLTWLTSWRDSDHCKQQHEPF